jgi:hypothetical protein
LNPLAERTCFSQVVGALLFHAYVSEIAEAWFKLFTHNVNI